MKIAIIGKSGTNSSVWTAEFLRAGWVVKTLGRNISVESGQKNHEYTYFDLDNYETYNDVLKGTDVLALSSPPHPKQAEREARLIDIAKAAEVPRIIKLSIIGADLPDPISPFARWAQESENHLRRSGIPFVIFRANLFMQNLLAKKSAIRNGIYAEPIADRALSLLDVRDIASAAVAVADGEHDDMTFNLTGPNALTGEQIAKTFSVVTGKDVQFISPDLAGFGKALVANKLPGWQVEGLVELYQNIQTGKNTLLSGISPDVSALLGRKPRDLTSFAKDFFLN